MARGSKSAIFGGLLGGIGEGLVSQAEKERAAAEALRAEALRKLERQEDRDFRKGLIAGTVSDAEGNLQGYTGGGDTIDLGIRGAPPSAASGSATAMNAREQAAWKNAVQVETTTDSNGNEVVDWDGVAKRLEAEYPRLAERARPRQGQTQPIDPMSDEWLRARQAAEKEAKAQAGWLSTDKTDFADDGGNREAFINRKALEIYRDWQNGGQAGTAPPPGGAPSPDETKPVEGVQGSGTQQDPYKPTTQEQFDQLPAGTIFINPSDGNLYRKK